jgi:ribosome-binding protein aMBF1 (putative translation factor)
MPVPTKKYKTLDNCMTAHGIRNKDLATAIKKDPSYIHRIRRRQINPSLAVAIAINKFFSGEIPIENMRKNQT